MKRFIWALVIIVIIVLVVWFGNNSGDKGVVKIGVVAPLKSGASIYGENLTKGMELAKKDLGIRGKKFQIVIEDDEGSVAKSASAAQKLINIDKVSAIVTVTSGTGNAVSQIARTYNIPHICDCVDTSIATTSGFIYSALPQTESDRWLKEARDRGLKKVFLVTQNQSGSILISKEMKSRASGLGIEIVGEESIEATNKDFKTEVSKLKQIPADMYMAVVFPPTLDILAKELKLQGINNFSSVGLLAISSNLSLFNEQWYTDNYLSDKEYQNRFEKEYPNTRFNVRSAPHGYDIFNLVVNGYESGDIVNYLKNLNEYDGKVGKAKKAIDNKNIFTIPIGIWEVKDGKTVLVGE